MSALYAVSLPYGMFQDDGVTGVFYSIERDAFQLVGPGHSAWFTGDQLERYRSRQYYVSPNVVRQSEYLLRWRMEEFGVKYKHTQYAVGTRVQGSDPVIGPDLSPENYKKWTGKLAMGKKKLLLLTT